MSSTSSSSTHINRKSLKRPDRLLKALTGAFDKVSSKSNVVVLALLGLLGLAVAVGLFMNHLEAQADSARNALFLAGQSLTQELKSISDAEKPKTPVVANLKDPKKPATPPVAETPITFKKLDVDTQLPEAVKKLKDIDHEFGRRRAAFEARLKLGDLYFNHGETAKALPWYEKAVSSAPGKFEKALALSSLGYTYENLEKPTDALQTYQKAANLGEGSLKGDLLMGVARSYEAAKDSAKARSTYDKILTELPNTEYAKNAELYKNQLP
jgi:tetratricopeptide (TPR) repeat protein